MLCKKNILVQVEGYVDNARLIERKKYAIKNTHFGWEVLSGTKVILNLCFWRLDIFSSVDIKVNRKVFNFIFIFIL